MKLNSIFIIILIFSCLSVLGQVIKVGEVEFNISENSLKPAGTLCGQVEVFEDNISNTGRKINLYIEVIPAINPDSMAAPIFIIMGGPGTIRPQEVSVWKMAELLYSHNKRAGANLLSLVNTCIHS